jgi:UDP-N-acetylmuramoyl-tripeptide--D-alanyl-D-alanine ligase
MSSDPMFTLAQCLPWLSGARLVGDCSVAVQRVHSDTRSVLAGDLFVALRGERFDANEFLAQAAAKGAVAALCQGDADAQLQAAGLPALVVPDARVALGELAQAWRRQLQLPLIAVTGSNGKTTVTQMIASILRAWKGEASLATQGNFNNDIGLPLTVLRLRAAHEVAVLELGMNHPGEIALLASIARPTVALVNNAQREHLEFMATVAAVAAENGAVIDALPADGVAVFPADDAFSGAWAKRAAGRAVLTFGEGGERQADVSALKADWTGIAWQVQARTPQGPLAYELGVAGLHNVRNSLAATACCLAVGVPLPAIAQGLAAFEPVKGRSRAFSLAWQGRSITVVDDSYNANPDSVQAAIEVLAGLPGPQLLVLGDMGEVGLEGPRFHAEAGEHARARGISQLFALGELSRGAAAAFGDGRHFDDIESLCAAALAALPGVGSVLVKGSRFMKMERVVEALTRAAASNTSPTKDDHVLQA